MTKLRLTFDVVIDEAGVPVDELKGNLGYMVERAIGDGDITCATDAEVESWEAKVEELPL